LNEPGPANLFALYGEYLGGWPDDYLSVDLETCGGLSPSDPYFLPVELGWCLVEGRRVVSNDAVVLNWLDVPGLDYTRIVRALAKTRGEMRALGYGYRFTPTVLMDEGVDPARGLRCLADLVRDTIDGGGMLVGHNIVVFDYPLLARCTPRWTRDAARFDPPLDRIIDTMCIARARQKPDFGLPCPGEARRQWYDRLARGPEKCSLFEHAAVTYGVDIDGTRAHQAGYDAYVTHQLVEKMRGLAEVTDAA
jgi:DNA polymerase III epsilon subunit-like protein